MSLLVTPDYITYADAVGVLIQQERALAKMFAGATLVSQITVPELVDQTVCAAENLLPQLVPASV